MLLKLLLIIYLIVLIKRMPININSKKTKIIRMTKNKVYLNYNKNNYKNNKKCYVSLNNKVAEINKKTKSHVIEEVVVFVEKINSNWINWLLQDLSIRQLVS